MLTKCPIFGCPIFFPEKPHPLPNANKHFFIRYNFLFGESGASESFVLKSKIMRRNSLSTIFITGKQMILMHCTLAPLTDGVFYLTYKNI